MNTNMLWVYSARKSSKNRLKFKKIEFEQNRYISDQCDNSVKMKSRMSFKSRFDKVSKHNQPIRTQSKQNQPIRIQSMQIQLFKSHLKYQITQVPNTKNPIQKLIQSIRAESGSEQISENLFNQMKNGQLVLCNMSSDNELKFSTFQNEKYSVKKLKLNKVQAKMEPLPDTESNDIIVISSAEKVKLNKAQPKVELLPNPDKDDIIRKLFNAGCHQILENMILNMTRPEIESCRSVSPDWNCIVMFYLGQKVNIIEKSLNRKATSMSEIEGASLNFEMFKENTTFGQFYNKVVA